MGQKLQTLFFTILLSVSMFLIWGSGTISKAQISLTDASPLEVRFSQETSERNESSLTVGLSDIQSILSQEYTLQTEHWQSYLDAESMTNYFVPGGISGTAPGRLQLENVPFQTFFAASIKNDSEYNFGNFIIAFDFIYNFYEFDNTHNFDLRYKVNDGAWNRLPSGVIGESTLRSVDDSWSSFSLHLNVDNVYLRPSDTIDFMWVIDGEEVTERIPLALQRIEIFPEPVEEHLLNRGDLIITEILPASDVNGSDFEYVEVYNPTETTISLKGIELKTENGSKVIQQDILVEPYDFTVISNADLSTLEGIGNSYFYSGSFIKPDGGRVELELSGELIASATYEPTEPGVAIELNRVSEAYDGYSSMQNFSVSQTSYFQDLYGSPGRSGSTSPMFRKILNEKGTYLLSFPGEPIQRLNRNSSLEFYSLGGTQLDISAIEPHRSIIVRKTDDSAVTLFTEAVSSQNTNLNNYTQITNHSQFLSTRIQTSGGGAAQRDKQNISQAFPVTQIWNSLTNKFTLNIAEQVQTNYWSPMMVHSSVADLLKSSENQIRSPLPDRFIEFGVLPENQGSSRLSDVVMVGFMDVPNQYGQIRYDLPKLTFEDPTNLNNRRMSSQLLYLTSTVSDESFNAFTHLPHEIDKEYELGLGYQMSDDAGGAVLRWKLSDEIPDEWVITLEDTFNGTVVDLREENEYRFRYTNSSGDEEKENIESPRLSSINPSERPRFVVNVQPYESFSNVSEEEEVPNSIELRPNYPNPFNPSTNINFYLPEERNVRVGVYNIVGQQVALLLDDVVQQGEHSIVWDASDKPSGIYIVQLETGSRIFTRKITLIK